MEAIVEFITSMPTGRFISAVIVLLLLAGLGLALHIFAKRMSDAIIVKDVLKEAKAREPKSTSAKAKIKMTPTAEGKPQSQKIEQMSIDAIFAKKTSRPLCKYCETINSFGATNCCVCGKYLSK